MRPCANWPVCPPTPTAAPPVTSPARTPPRRRSHIFPPGAGASPTAILAEGGLLYRPPLSKAPAPQAPGRCPPPPPPSRCANWRIRKIAISSPPCPPGSCPPGLAPRAPASPPLHFHLPSTPPTGAANSPAAPTGAPRPPSRAAKHPRPPLAPGLGGGARRRRMVAWGPACRGGSYREGHPARAPTVRSPAIPASLTQRDAATLADPHSLSPGPLGPGRFYTDSPTPFGV
ncbi:hypothetical protein N7519_000004 [Penicillium mononematosum]|uniref:uncharacterized protein n=1 Tax=Penicillium mononematosum TaxID=268346 RepID=UPI002547A1F2|nr:uncharacterized protein N7519_000004 [Penicillium mononematosum]KAJ6189983.1 hypothetical protein N7519_000004 [Penicillium mononematosum]